MKYIETFIVFPRAIIHQNKTMVSNTIMDRGLESLQWQGINWWVFILLLMSLGESHSPKCDSNLLIDYRLIVSKQTFKVSSLLYCSWCTLHTKYYTVKEALVDKWNSHLKFIQSLCCVLFCFVLLIEAGTALPNGFVCENKKNNAKAKTTWSSIVPKVKDTLLVRMIETVAEVTEQLRKLHVPD